MTQKERLLNYLKQHGRINPLQSWQALGIYRLSAVVLDLRKEGHDIQTVNTPVKNQFGEKCNVATYVYTSPEGCSVMHSAREFLRQLNDKSTT